MELGKVTGAALTRLWLRVAWLLWTSAVPSVKWEIDVKCLKAEDQIRLSHCMCLDFQENQESDLQPNALWVQALSSQGPQVQVQADRASGA